MAIGDIIQGILHSEIFGHLKEKGVDIAKDVSTYLSKKVGEMIKGIVDGYVEEKISVFKLYIDSELKKLKLQILKYVIIGFVIQTAVIIAILFLFFKR